ncbi:MAG: NAD(P)H-dependent oxidoreductase [Tatlockia sp.]|nr:NAD(P)H-dependent oxidoreductase [Tatlockia sp.]
MKKKIGIIVGSLRKESWSRKLAQALIKLLPSSFEAEIVEIGELPLYNPDPDDEGRPCQEWTSFREKLKAVDGLLFITPEYNRSIPAPLKNAIDVGSRPYGQSVWGKKPAAVVSCSPGAIGGFGANQHLRQTFVFLDVPCMQAPEIYIAGIDKLFDEKGDIVNVKTLEFLNNFITSYSNWFTQLKS